MEVTVARSYTMAPEPAIYALIILQYLNVLKISYVLLENSCKYRTIHRNAAYTHTCVLRIILKVCRFIGLDSNSKSWSEVHPSIHPATSQHILLILHTQDCNSSLRRHIHHHSFQMTWDYVLQSYHPILQY